MRERYPVFRTFLSCEERQFILIFFAAISLYAIYEEPGEDFRMLTLKLFATDLCEGSVTKVTLGAGGGGGE